MSSKFLEYHNYLGETMGLKRPTPVTYPVRCVICGEGLRYRRDDTRILIKHLKDSHPGVNMTILPCEPIPEKEKIETKSRRQRIQDSLLSPKSKCKMYKTTVETWRPGPSKITCPSCGKTGEPSVRKQRSKISRSQLAAMCLMGCWPICFLPCLLANNPISDLHCCYCNYYLGAYNSKLMKIIPNQTSTTDIRKACKNNCFYVEDRNEDKRKNHVVTPKKNISEDNPNQKTNGSIKVENNSSIVKPRKKLSNNDNVSKIVDYTMKDGHVENKYENNTNIEEDHSKYFSTQNNTNDRKASAEDNSALKDNAVPDAKVSREESKSNINVSKEDINIIRTGSRQTNEQTNN